MPYTPSDRYTPASYRFLILLPGSMFTSRLFLNCRRNLTNGTSIESWTQSILAKPPVTHTTLLHPLPVQLLNHTLSRPHSEHENVILPPFYHHLFFPSTTPLSSDGYHMDYQPPAPYEKRMWGGGELHYHYDVRLKGMGWMRVSCDKVEVKRDKVWVWEKREIGNESEEKPGITELRCIVYMKREKDMEYKVVSKRLSAEERRTPEFHYIVDPDEILLFRYSALSFNSHRIHYDHLYATQVEGFPGVLVHGPLTATLLLNAARDKYHKHTMERFNYRALSPLPVRQRFKICGRRVLKEREKENEKVTCEVWAENTLGGLMMRGMVSFTPS